MEAYEKTTEYLRMALSHMGRHGIPVDPKNYAVWYDYVGGDNASLKETIDDMVERGKPFTPEINSELYKRYVADFDFEKKEETLQGIRTLLLGFTRQLVEMGRNLSENGQSFEEYAKQLENDVDVDGLRTILNDVLQKTRESISVGRTFNRQLVNTAKELDSLREELNQAKQRATTDPLTGLLNRRALEELLIKRTADMETAGSPLCILFADIDHFKLINDKFGHLVGDMVLKMSASILKSLVKGTDTTARYGGEEFLIVLPETPLEGAVRVAENLRRHFEQKEWRQKQSGSSIGAITMSFGVAELRPGENARDLIQRADEALYKAKNGGRNQVRAAE